jgi:hypothetical protein
LKGCDLGDPSGHCVYPEPVSFDIKVTPAVHCTTRASASLFGGIIVAVEIKVFDARLCKAPPNVAVLDGRPERRFGQFEKVTNLRDRPCNVARA